MSDDSFVTIAVLSDMHVHADRENMEYVAYLRTGMPEKPTNQHPVNALLALIDEETITADFLLTPGDICDKADKLGLQSAWQWIHQIGERLGVKQTIATTGNHDLDSRYIEGNFDAKGYLQLLSPSYPVNNENLSDKYWSRNFILIEDETVRILVINSSAYHGGKQGEIEHGRISEITIEAIKNRLDSSENKLVNICLIHHHPHKYEEINYDDYEVMLGGDKLLKMLGAGRYGKWLVIHGHRHFPRVAYAQGGASAPVVFSAGSFSAVLYKEISSRTSNQFYIVEIPKSEIKANGLVGTIRAWDWSSGHGWVIPQDRLDALPVRSGFGCTEDLSVIAKKINNALDEPFMKWLDLTKKMPNIRYLSHDDFNEVKHILDKSFSVNFTYYKDGTPAQVGKEAKHD